MQPRSFRTALQSDYEQIDAIRVANGSRAPRESDVNYFVCERRGRITAFYGIRKDPTSLRALVVDFYGVKAADWRALMDNVRRWADEAGIQLSAWVDIQNKNIPYFWMYGFSPRMVLISREPEVQGRVAWELSTS